MKKTLIFTGLAVLLVGVPLLGKLTRGHDAKAVEVQKAEVRVIKSSILASGTLAFREQVQLRAEVIGRVMQLHVKEGDQVKRGDMVITLDPKTYQAQVEQAEAHVRIQRIAIERQRLLIKNLADRYQRQKAMFAKALVDEDSFEALENEYSLARVDLRSLQESLSQARAALDQSKELLEKTRIRSPIDGVVIQIDVKVGETVIAGTTNIPGSTMMVIADPSETLTEVQVDEADIALVHAGQSADIYAAAYPDTPLPGKVQSIASVARKAEGQQSLSFLVKILLDKQEDRVIRPGMSARADIYTHSSQKALAVPVQAVRYDEGTGREEGDGKDDKPAAKSEKADEEQAYVFVIRDGKAARRDVKTGLASDSDQEITSGLKAGEDVITGPYRVLRRLRDGDAVKKSAKRADKASGSVSIEVD